MSDYNFKWIRVSVFYDSASWHCLINNCIKPFIISMKKEKYIDQFFLHLNKTQGDHIRLSIKAPEHSIPELLKIWDTQIDAFLKANPTVTNSRKSPDALLSSSNSVLYDLYKPYTLQTDLISETELEKARYLISDAILMTLSAKPINQESTLMFCLNLQSGIIRAAFHDHNKAASELMNLLTSLLSRFDPTQQAGIEDKTNALYYKNKTTLTKVVTGIYADENNNQEINWLHSWVLNCRGYIHSGKPFQHLFIQLSTILREHFDFIDLPELLVNSYLIYKSLIESAQDHRNVYKKNMEDQPVDINTGSVSLKNAGHIENSSNQHSPEILTETTLTCIGLNQIGRFGNQLFQIASLLGLAKEYGYAIALPTWPYAPYFNIKSNALTALPTTTIQESEFHYTPEYYQQLKNINGVINLHGYFQSSKYWKTQNISFTNSFLKQIRDKHYTFTKPTIGIHIRRGDYVNNPDFYLLPENYYIFALLEHFPDLKNYQIILFSDDIAYAKIHFECLENAHFSEGLSDVEDMALMSLCDHFIVSNSTFSWWAAYLGQKEHSKVIHPVQYFKGSKKAYTTKDFWEPNWIAFDYTTYKYDLSHVTFTIPVSFDHKHREENLHLSVDMLEKSFITNIIVGEQGGEILSPIKERCSYINFPLANFHRTKMLNELCKLSKSDCIVNWDCDVILSPLQIILAAELIKNDIADFVYPYDGRFTRLPRTFFSYVDKHRDIGIAGLLNLGSLDDTESFGGAVFYKKDAFIEAGKENEYFVSYGPEDWERIDRFKKLGFKIKRVKGQLFHMNHYIGPNSSHLNPHFKRNEEHHHKQKKMTGEELKAYVKTWPWLK